MKNGNKDYNAVDTLSDWIISTCKKLIEKATFDRTYEGVISSVNDEGYTVEYAGASINIKTTAINIYKVGEKVRICMPMGNKRKAFIMLDMNKITSLINN